MRTILPALVFALVSLGCGGGSLGDDGEQCFSSAECAQGLLCDFGATPSVCRPRQTFSPIPDAAPAPVDGPENQPDAGSTPDAAVPVDAPPPVDAPAPDAAT